MTEDEAMKVLTEKYDLITAGRLVHYAMMLQGFGPEHFDNETSRAHRYKFITKMREAGVYWDTIEFKGAFERWWLAAARKRRARRTA
jgi:hypothetical protein